MPKFVHLLNPDAYLPGLWDLATDLPARRSWRERLEESMRDICALVGATQGTRAGEGARAAAEQWGLLLSGLSTDEPFPHRTVLEVVAVRDHLLREQGIDDAFRAVKEEENARCLDLPLELFQEPASTWIDRVETACAGVLAGNVFDMAAPLVARAYAEGPERLMELTARARARAPVIDHRAALRARLERLGGQGSGEVLVLVDNAGLDFIQGVVPLALVLASAGLTVTLAANALPSLNDVTSVEAEHLLAELGERHESVRRARAEGRVRVVTTGNASPGIDLRDVSEALNEASAGVDLVVIVGQGRAIETTWFAELAVPTLRLATLKSRLVSARLGLVPLDTILDLRDAGGAAPPRSALVDLAPRSAP